MIQAGGMATLGKEVLERRRFAFLATAWLAYMVFTVAGHPYCGVSVMLPSILLCGFAAWLYGYKTGVLTSILSQPYNVLVMMYNLDSLQGWRVALEPGGIATQLIAVFVIAMMKNNRKKCLELAASLKEQIRQRNENLEEITKYMVTQSEAERSRMSETLCNIVAYQQTGLFYHSEALRNFLVYGNAPQADAAIKLVQIAKENMEQVKHITRRLSPQRIMESGIKQALHEMCAYFTETTNTDFTISLGDRLGKIPEKTSLNIYRIAHEAVTNALRHGKATHVALSLKLAEETCTLEVVNNGNPLPSTPSEGLGMKLIQQRADSIHATTTFEATIEGQTRFECTVPLRHDSKESETNLPGTGH
ncbi:MAG: hypothetical protein KAH99_00140 [Verrucomicrobia bacterium]|nr:hypothetical protein [Verrucomicrobiota bacterium]